MDRSIDFLVLITRDAGLEVHDRKQQVRIGLDALVGSDSTDKLIRFADLVAAAEREACAKACDHTHSTAKMYTDVADVCAKRIRARSDHAA